MTFGYKERFEKYKKTLIDDKRKYPDDVWYQQVLGDKYVKITSDLPTNGVDHEKTQTNGTKPSKT